MATGPLSSNPAEIANRRFQRNDETIQRQATAGIPVRYVSVITSDDDDLANYKTCIGLYISVAGNIKFECQEGSAVTMAVTNFSFLPGVIKKVHATSTTATGIFAMFSA